MYRGFLTTSGNPLPHALSAADVSVQDRSIRQMEERAEDASLCVRKTGVMSFRTALCDMRYRTEVGKLAQGFAFDSRRGHS